VGVVLLAGCASGTITGAAGRPSAAPAPQATSPAPATTTRPSQVDVACLSKAERTKVVRFPAGDGATLTGVLLGRGPVGVVLAHQSDGDLCQWMPFAHDLARMGVRALAFNFEGYGSSTVGGDVADPLGQDVRAAAGRLHAAGARRVVLVGGSMGGTAVLSAAGHQDPAVAGVVSLSGPATFPGADASAAVPSITVPLLLAAGRLDEPFVQDARALFGRATGARKQLLIVPGTAHGVQLMGPSGPVRRAVLALLHRTT